MKAPPIVRRTLNRHCARALVVREPHPDIARLLASTETYPAVEAVLPDDTSPWPITRALGRLLARAVVGGGAERVLEFGAGSSSVVLAQALALRGGGRLTSVEQRPEWCAERWAAVERTPGVDARLVAAAPRLAAGRGGVYHQFTQARAAIAERGPYDLVLVDAPQYYYGRDGALHLVRELLRPGALLVLDDAGRDDEQWTLYRWLRTYRGLRLAAFDPRFGGRGVALLVHTGDPATRLHPGVLLSSAGQALQHWPVRRRERPGA